jgi:hypothetical protein
MSLGLGLSLSKGLAVKALGEGGEDGRVFGRRSAVHFEQPAGIRAGLSRAFNGAKSKKKKKDNEKQKSGREAP